MGTRGMLGFIAGGERKGTYNHYDSYPGWLGTNVLGWLRKVVAGGHEAETIARVTALRQVTDATPVTNEARARLARTQGNPQAILAAGYALDGWAFSEDAIFCEYVYVVDFDTRTLLAWNGHLTGEPTARWSFDNLPTDDAFVQAVAYNDQD